MRIDDLISKKASGNRTNDIESFAAAVVALPVAWMIKAIASSIVAIIAIRGLEEAVQYVAQNFNISREEARQQVKRIQLQTDSSLQAEAVSIAQEVVRNNPGARAEDIARMIETQRAVSDLGVLYRYTDPGPGIRDYPNDVLQKDLETIGRLLNSPQPPMEREELEDNFRRIMDELQRRQSDMVALARSPSEVLNELNRGGEVSDQELDQAIRRQTEIADRTNDPYDEILRDELQEEAQRRAYQDSLEGAR